MKRVRRLRAGASHGPRSFIHIDGKEMARSALEFPCHAPIHGHSCHLHSIRSKMAPIHPSDKPVP